MCTDAAITCRAIQSGTHFLVVQGSTVLRTGGYFISVTEAPLTAIPFINSPNFETVDSPFGPMTVLVSAASGFSVQIPADWFEVEITKGAEFAYGDGAANVLLAGSVIRGPETRGLSLEELADLVVSLFPATVNGEELLDRVRLSTAQGLDAVRLDWNISGGLIRINQMIILHESYRVTTLTAQAIGSEYEDSKELFDYIFESFRLQ